MNNRQEEKQYVLGLDIGSASCGWAVVDLDSQKILDAGVRCFELPEEDKTKKSLQKIRGEKKRACKMRMRKKDRLTKIRQLFYDNGLISSNSKNFLSYPVTANDNPIAYRDQGLKRLLEPIELARALYHIAKHRGFYFQSKSKDKDEGKVKEGLSEIDQIRKRYSTVGQMLANDEKFFSRKRNKNDYLICIRREWLRDEVVYLIEQQRKFGCCITRDFEEKFKNLFFNQEPLKSTEHMVGFCRFEKGESRSPKTAPLFERFRFLDNLHKIKVNGRVNPEFCVRSSFMLDSLRHTIRKQDGKLVKSLSPLSNGHRPLT